MFNLTAHPYFISSKSSRYSLVIARVVLLRKSNFVRRICEQAWGNLLSETRANLRNSLIRMPFSRTWRGRAYRAKEGLNRFVTDPLISHMWGFAVQEGRNFGAISLVEKLDEEVRRYKYIPHPIAVHANRFQISHHAGSCDLSKITKKNAILDPWRRERRTGKN